MMQHRWLALLTSRTPLLLGVLSFFCVAATLDTGSEFSWTADGPGLTFDENLNTISGVYVTESAIQAGLGLLDPRTLHEIFNAPSYHPDYPPLGRLPLGLTNAVLARVLGLGEHQFYTVTYARVGSALCFALLVWLVSSFTSRLSGPVAGIIAGTSLLLTPRVFGHAHLASVETSMNLAYVACIFTWISCLRGEKPPRASKAILGGVVLGLALLTKIQAIFLPPVIALWLIWNWKLKGILPLIILAITSWVVFVCGWPWLWSDPIGRSITYFTQSSERITLYCYYLGERYLDREVPWHYPFVMFLVTTPIPWLVAGTWGVMSGFLRTAETPQSRQGNQLLLGAFWLPLIAFAIPEVPVYDGERLFLVVWPIFAVWTGIAGQAAWNSLRSRWGAGLTVSTAILSILIPLSTIWTVFPAFLSSYELQSGGLWGANRLGMERNYWGDALTPDLLEAVCQEIPEGSTLGVAPVSHPAFPQFLKQETWLRNRPDLNVIAYDDQLPTPPRYVLHLFREADPWKSLTPPPEGTRILGQVVRQGVVLSEVLELPSLPAVGKEDPLAPKRIVEP